MDSSPGLVSSSSSEREAGAKADFRATKHDNEPISFNSYGPREMGL